LLHLQKTHSLQLSARKVLSLGQKIMQRYNISPAIKNTSLNFNTLEHDTEKLAFISQRLFGSRKTVSICYRAGKFILYLVGYGQT